MKINQYIIGIVLAILITVTAHVGFNTFYPDIEYPQNDCYPKDRVLGADYTINQTCMDAFDAQYTLFEQNRDTRDRWAFGMLSVLGLLFLFAGMFLVLPRKKQKSAEIITFGLLLAGFLIIISATMRSWTALSQVTQFVTLLIEIAILIWIVLMKIR